MRIGVISDTHIASGGQAIPRAVLTGFAGVEAILHAGDVLCQEVLDQLGAIAPVHVVHGNVDPPDLARRLPARLVLERGGARIGLTHGHLGRGSTTPDRALAYFEDSEDLSVIVFGHSHVPYNARHGDILLFNPGSPTQRRQQPRASYGLLSIDDGIVTGTIILL